MAKTKTIMDMTPQELLKMFVASVGELIKAENETLKTVLMAEIKASEKRVKDELKAELASKHDLRQLDTKIADHETRIHQLEEDTEFPHRN